MVIVPQVIKPKRYVACECSRIIEIKHYIETQIRFEDSFIPYIATTIDDTGFPTFIMQEKFIPSETYAMWTDVIENIEYIGELPKYLSIDEILNIAKEKCEVKSFIDNTITQYYEKYPIEPKYKIEFFICNTKQRECKTENYQEFIQI